MLVNEFLEISAERYPDKLALICQDKKLTFAEINLSASSFAHNLIAEGFNSQDRAVVYVENSVESVVSIFGILKAGGIFVVVNPKVKAPKLAYIIADCQARFLITDASHLKQISDIIKDLPSLSAIIISDFEKANKFSDLIPEIRLLPYSKMAEANFPNSPAERCIDIDLAGLIYTSGSSGNPKGVMLTHHNMVSAATSITQYLKNTQEDIILDALPLSFDYGLYQVLMSFKIGGTVILEKGFVFPEQIIKIVTREKVTGWPIVPTMAAILLRLKNINRHDFSSLKYITSTGQVLPSGHITRLRAIFPGVKIYSMYGLTECKRVSYLPPEEIDKRPGSVGKGMPNTQVYLIDDEGEKISKPGKSGELVVRGSNVMKGYWNLPIETEKALRPGHYPGEKILYTGDLFKLDQEGYLYFLGRKDDIIKTSGHMVSPKEVENVLCEIEDVIEAAVIGVEDEILGKAIKAFVQLTESSRATEKDVISFCEKHLEDYAVPKHISFCGPLPRTESGKIQKRDLK
jgi:long-chain acyl-CoA synthetase